MNEDNAAGSRPGRGPAGLAELPDRLLAMLRASPAGELEQHLRAGLQQGIERLDLVTREEYELQVEMVERLRARVEALEAKLSQQEAGRSPGRVTTCMAAGRCESGVPFHE